MKLPRVTSLQGWALLGCGLMSVAATGCQTTIGGQTLPSPYYLEDDVQYFPAGPEFLLPNQVRALDEYRLQQAAIQTGLNAPVPLAPTPPVPPAMAPAAVGPGPADADAILPMP